MLKAIVNSLRHCIKRQQAGDLRMIGQRQFLSHPCPQTFWTGLSISSCSQFAS